jgi:hypothetical protein
MATIREQLDEIKAQKESPMPTAPIGMTVQWFDRNEDDRCYAALVTFQEGPGKVKLSIIRPNGHIQHRDGVLHRTHELHKNKHNTITMKNGAWDYIPGQPPLKSHRELHLKELERREVMLVQAEKAEKEQHAPVTAKK